jgi:hypothetical protein
MNMFNKYEVIGGAISVVCMVAALYLVQARSELALLGKNSQVASPSGVVVVGSGEDVTRERTDALLEAIDGNGDLSRMVIDDVKMGEGAEVAVGDTVNVHYVGSLPDGTEFDNSRKRGQTFRFTVGAGQVIAGWEEGLVGMKAGGQRILIVPPEKAYGPDGVGPIPGNATLVFAIDLVTIE